MRTAHGNKLLVLGLFLLGLTGCLVTPKNSTWMPPSDITYPQLFQASVKVAEELGFTIIEQNQTSGKILLEQKSSPSQWIYLWVSLGKTSNTDSRLIVRAKAGDKLLDGFSDTPKTIFGVVTRKFYSALFRELNITDPSARNVDIQDN